MSRSPLKPENQCDWHDIVEWCAFTRAHICKEFGFVYSTFCKWVRFSCPSHPSTPELTERVVRAMSYLKKHPRLQRHPSYGWATPEQIKRLNEIGICPERNAILEQIEQQTKSKGRKK